MDEFVIRQEDECAFNPLRAFIRLPRQEAVAVPVRWPGAYVPELNDVLGRISESFALRLQCVDSPANQWKFRVVRFDEAQQNVGISQV